MIEKQLLWDKICKSNAQDIKAMYLYIKTLIELKCDIEQYGIINGREQFLKTASEFEKFAINLMISEKSQHELENILINILNSSNLSDTDYVKNVIFCEFVLDIQNIQIGLQELSLKLCSYLGITAFENLYHEKAIKI